MALIGTIRKRSGLLIIIVGIALAAFVLGDFLSPRYGRGRENIPLATVLGEDIPYSQFDAKFEQNHENQKKNQQKEALTAEELFNLRQQTWDQVVQSMIGILRRILMFWMQQVLKCREHCLLLLQPHLITTQDLELTIS